MSEGDTMPSSIRILPSSLRKVPFLLKFYAAQVLVSLTIILIYLWFLPLTTPALIHSVRTLNEYLGISLSSAEQVNKEPFSQDNHQYRFPSCIIFGVSKGGTRAALEYLKIHPDVVAPGSEVHYWNNVTLQREKGLDWFLRQMPPSASHQITVEKSPDYFQHPHSARLIYKANNRTKLLLLLRDPVERLVSEYMQISEKTKSLPVFEKWVVDPRTGEINTRIPSVKVGCYSEMLKSWLESFPLEQIHVVDSFKLTQNPLREMKSIERFLKLRPYIEPDDFYFNSTKGFYCIRRRPPAGSGIKCLGLSKGREHISVKPEVIDQLRKFYHPYNLRLKALLKRDFSWFGLGSKTQKRSSIPS